jgi:peptidoglycan/LPS O-acetylase OafA/YrhL
LEIKQDNYIKSLDGLRFLAVIFVLLDHWTNYRLGFPASYFGVSLFFVLSGYLITNILIKAKTADNINKRSHWKSLKLFYIRRTLRIFPIYYLVIFVLYLLNRDSIRQYIFWLLTYQTNNFIAYKDAWIGSFDHFWSLAVEEQFYLFFPFLIFFVKLKNLPKIVFSLVLLSVGLRFWFYFNHYSWIKPFVLMPTSLDALGLGSLLAFYLFNKNESQLPKASLLKKLVLISFLSYIFILYLLKSSPNDHNFYSVVPLRFFESMFALSLIFSFITIDDNGIFAKTKRVLFENKFVVYIGRISYGIYIYHHFTYNYYYSKTDDFIPKVFNKFNNLAPGLGDNIFVQLAIIFPIVVLISSISWHFFEKPINDLKDKYKY